MIDDELRDHGPAGLTDDERSDLRLDLLATIRSEGHGPQGLAERPHGRRRRRTVAFGVAAAVLATATAAAAFAGLTRPDPKQAATIITNSEAVASAHPEGWRPELNAELAMCVGAAGTDDFEAYASDGPLESALAATDLIDACSAKAATLDGSGTEGAGTICRTGTAGAATFASPTVLLNSSDCSSAGLEDYTAGDIGELNDARAVEVALRAIGNPCPSRNEVLAWVRTQADRTGTSLSIYEGKQAGEPPKVCFGTYVNWVAGTAYIDTISTAN